jgi:hypothetical protein
MSRPKAKRCPPCSQVKPTGQFYRRRQGRRLSPYCKSCQRAAARAALKRRRQDLAATEQLRAVDRARQRRHRTLGGPGPGGGDASMTTIPTPPAHPDPATHRTQMRTEG